MSLKLPKVKEKPSYKRVLDCFTITDKGIEFTFVQTHGSVRKRILDLCENGLLFIAEKLANETNVKMKDGYVFSTFMQAIYDHGSGYINCSTSLTYRLNILLENHYHSNCSMVRISTNGFIPHEQDYSCYELYLKTFKVPATAYSIENGFGLWDIEEYANIYGIEVNLLGKDYPLWEDPRLVEHILFRTYGQLVYVPDIYKKWGLI